MRRIELITALPGSAAAAWATLIDVDSWPQWGRLVTSAVGEFEPGARWTMQLVGDGPARVMRPYFVSMAAPESVAFETRLIGVHIVHTFVIRETEGASELLQTFDITGALVPLLWRVIRSGVVQFDALGEDLARRLGD